MMEVLNEYLAFLWNQFQYDWSIMSNPWVLFTIVPVLLYLVFFFIKWFILLAPITIPLSIIAPKTREKPDVNAKKEVKEAAEKIVHLLKE